MYVRELFPVSEAEAPYFIGIDLGGTNIKSGVVDNEGRCLGYTTITSNVQEGPEVGAGRMALAAKEAICQAGLRMEQVSYVGLGTPGMMDIPTGMLLNIPNLPGWSNFPIRDRVSQNVGLPVAYANDANAVYSYDSASRLSSITNNTNTLHKYAYTYDDVGNRLTMRVNNDVDETHTYTYNNLYRVTNVDYPASYSNLVGDTQFKYDAVMDKPVNGCGCGHGVFEYHLPF